MNFEMLTYSKHGTIISHIIYQAHIPCLHCVPVAPSGHKQINRPCVLTQVPPRSQGSLRHSSISVHTKTICTYNSAIQIYKIQQTISLKLKKMFSLIIKVELFIIVYINRMIIPYYFNYCFPRMISFLSHI